MKASSTVLGCCRYYSLLEADHILFIISPRRAGVHFDILYRSIFKRCRNVEPSLSMKRSHTVPALSHVAEVSETTSKTDLREVGKEEKENAIAAKAQVPGLKKGLRRQSKSQSAGDVRSVRIEGEAFPAVPSGDTRTTFEALNLPGECSNARAIGVSNRSSSSAVPCGAGSCSGSDCECLQGRTTSESSGGVSREGSDAEDCGVPASTRDAAEAFLAGAHPAKLGDGTLREAGGNALWGEERESEEEEEQWEDAQPFWADADSSSCAPSSSGEAECAFEVSDVELRTTLGAACSSGVEAPCALPVPASESPEGTQFAEEGSERGFGVPKARYRALAGVANRVSLDRWKRRKRRGHGRPVSPFFCAGIPPGM